MNTRLDFKQHFVRGITPIPFASVMRSLEEAGILEPVMQSFNFAQIFGAHQQYDIFEVQGFPTGSNTDEKQKTLPTFLFYLQYFGLQDLDQTKKAIILLKIPEDPSFL